MRQASKDSVEVAQVAETDFEGGLCYRKVGRHKKLLRLIDSNALYVLCKRDSSNLFEEPAEVGLRHMAELGNLLETNLIGIVSLYVSEDGIETLYVSVVSNIVFRLYCRLLLEIRDKQEQHVKKLISQLQFIVSLLLLLGLVHLFERPADSCLIELGRRKVPHAVLAVAIEVLDVFEAQLFA